MTETISFARAEGQLDSRYARQEESIELSPSYIVNGPVVLRMAFERRK